MTEERSGQVTFQGNPLTLVGPEIKAGDRAPAFRLVNMDLQPVTLADPHGRIRLITTVPSLDTPVCDAMTRRFNEDAAGLPDDVVVAAVSMDLPFAQKRWCANAGIEKVQTLSDYQGRAFARDYGMLIRELMLLARGVFVIDPEGMVTYRELVNEVTVEPDYAAAPRPKIGSPAPDFSARTSTGRDLNLSDYRGKVVLLDFWAVWCPPCRDELPALVDFYKRHRRGGFEIIAVNIDDGVIRYAHDGFRKSYERDFDREVAELLAGKQDGE